MTTNTSLLKRLLQLFGCSSVVSNSEIKKCEVSSSDRYIGLIAGNGDFALRFVREAKAHGCKVSAVCHFNETSPEIANLVDEVAWIYVGQLGKMISHFKRWGVQEVAMAGGISRVKTFKDLRLDGKALKLLAKLHSTKDDTIMRGVAMEIEAEGMRVISCTEFLKQCMVQCGLLTKRRPTKSEYRDIEVGKSAIATMGDQHIGQLMVVKDGVVVAVEAVEGSDAAILRGGELGGKGTVVVKFAKPTQDMRFDVPTIGPKTIETMIKVKARVLALEAGKCLMLEEEKVIELANRNKIAIIGC